MSEHEEIVGGYRVRYTAEDPPAGADGFGPDSLGHRRVPAIRTPL